MLGNLALNLSVDAGLSLVNDVMNAVSGSASNQPLTPSGNAGSGSAFGGQGGFGEILNNSIDNLSNSANNQNQSGAVQPISSSLNNAPNAAPVSPVNQQANGGGKKYNYYGNNYVANQGGNNIGSNSADNVSYAGRPANNTVNAGNDTNKNNNTAGNNATGDNVAATGAAGQSAGNAVEGNSQKASKNADSVGNSVKQASVNNNVATANNNGADGQAVYFVGNTNINILIQPASIKKGDKAGNGEGGVAGGAGGIKVKSGGKTPLTAPDALFSSSTAAALYRSQSQNSNNSVGGNSAGNPSDKTFASVLTENAGKKIADNAAAQNTGGGTAEQSAPVKIGGAADKNSENGPAQKAASVLLNAFNRSSQNNQKVQASNANVSNVNIINTANTKTLIKDAAVNALNLNVLIGEAKPALSGNNEGNIAGNNAGADSGSGIAGGIKTSGFISAGFSDASISGLNGSASGGNSGGLNLSGGNIAGLDDSSGGTNAASAVNSVMFMLRKNVQSAVITLNPASLGTVKINISLNNPNSALNSLNQSAASNGAITINMLAQNEAAKNMLQSSSDLLQNALKNQGFSSINLNISTGSGYNNQNGNGGETLKNPFTGANYNGGFSNGTSGPDSDLVLGAVSNGVNNFMYRNPNSLVDYFV